MFTGGRRCGDRISPVFGSAANAVVIVGHVLRFGSYVPARCLHMHSLPPLQCCWLSQTVLSRVKTLLSLSTQVQEQPETETHTDHLCQSLKWQRGTVRVCLPPLKCEVRSCFHVFSCPSLLLRICGQVSVSGNLSSHLFAMISVSWHDCRRSWISIMRHGSLQRF